MREPAAARTFTRAGRVGPDRTCARGYPPPGRALRAPAACNRDPPASPATWATASPRGSRPVRRIAGRFCIASVGVRRALSVPHRAAASRAVTVRSAGPGRAARVSPRRSRRPSSTAWSLRPQAISSARGWPMSTTAAHFDSWWSCAPLRGASSRRIRPSASPYSGCNRRPLRFAPPRRSRRSVPRSWDFSMLRRGRMALRNPIATLRSRSGVWVNAAARGAGRTRCQPEARLRPPAAHVRHGSGLQSGHRGRFHTGAARRLRALSHDLVCPPRRA